MQKFAYDFFAKVTCVYGMPIHIVSDNDILFETEWWKACVHAMGLQHARCDIYTPQGNGMVEKANSRIISRIKSMLMVAQEGHTWVTQLPVAQWSVNSVPGAGGFSVNEAVYGRHLSHLDSALRVRGTPRPAEVTGVDEWVESRDRQLIEFRRVLETVDAAQKVQVEKHRRTQVRFSVGDLVWIQVRPISQHGQAVEAKVAPRWHGPARVVSVSGRNHYDLDYDDEQPAVRYAIDRLRPYVAVECGPLEKAPWVLGKVPRPAFSCA